jgi:hypothetical protein
MPVDTATVLREIDSVLARYDEVEQQYRRYVGDGRDVDGFIAAPAHVEAEIVALLDGAITRYAPVGYGEGAITKAPAGGYNGSDRIRTRAGALIALRADYAGGRLQTLQERVRADTFSDFLAMAEYLIEDEGLKDPAAVLAGGVLEQHLRKLHVKHVGPVPVGATINPLNDALKKPGVYGANEHKQVTAWAALRNSAAHGDWGKYDATTVRLMIQWVRWLLSNYPA